MLPKPMILRMLLLALIAAGLVFLIWLGWGRSRSWQASIGWDALPEAARARAAESLAAFTAESGAPRLRWWGHATLEVDWVGQQLILDPVASARIQLAPRLINDLKLDVSQHYSLILLTHAHMDHLDNPTLERLPPSQIILPAGSEDFLSARVRKRHKVLPLELGEVFAFGELQVIPVPARHGGWRYPWQKGYWACGYLIRHAGRSIYIAGDTSMGPHFEAIARDYAPDYAVLPIGAYAPQWFLQSRHLNPEEAWQAAATLGVAYVIPYHFGTFRLSLEPVKEPLLRWATGADSREIPWLLPVE